jgi:hypothetical protein
MLAALTRDKNAVTCSIFDLRAKAEGLGHHEDAGSFSAFLVVVSEITAKVHVAVFVL